MGPRGSGRGARCGVGLAGGCRPTALAPGWTRARRAPHPSGPPPSPQAGSAACAITWANGLRRGGDTRLQGRALAALGAGAWGKARKGEPGTCTPGGRRRVLAGPTGFFGGGSRRRRMRQRARGCTGKRQREGRGRAGPRVRAGGARKNRAAPPGGAQGGLASLLLGGGGDGGGTGAPRRGGGRAGGVGVRAAGPGPIGRGP
jgi:hypothetical protein